MTGASTLERALRHDRAIVLAAIAAITAMAGLYTLFGVGMPMSAIEMTGMAGTPVSAMEAPTWHAGYVFLVFLMWWVMMIAMMTPSAAPALLLFAAIKRQSAPGRSVAPVVWLFLSGYLVAWAGFSAAATGLQWALQSLCMIAPVMMILDGAGLAGAVLILAGIYQVTPLKDACLTQCRSPAQFLVEHHRTGRAGALVMGMEHGAYCVGCCWVLMVLLFVGGVMNLYWIVGLAIVVAAEKLLPHGKVLSRVLGLVLMFAGLWVWRGGL